jgi:hypothetical protein
MSVTDIEIKTIKYNTKLQGDQKVSVHLMVTVQKHAKTVSITYHDNVVRIRDNR